MTAAAAAAAAVVRRRPAAAAPALLLAVVVCCVVVAVLTGVQASRQIGLVRTFPLTTSQTTFTTLYKINADTTVGGEYSGKTAPTTGSGVVQLTTGEYLCALHTDGSVTCDTNFGYDLPNIAGGYSQVVSVTTTYAAGGADALGGTGARCVCMLARATGYVSCVGQYDTLIPMPSNTSFSHIQVTGYGACGLLRADGALYCWGDAWLRGANGIVTNNNLAPQTDAVLTAMSAYRFVDLSCGSATITSQYTNNYGFYTLYPDMRCCGVTKDAGLVCFGLITGQIPTMVMQAPSRYVHVAISSFDACALDFSGQATCFRPFVPFPTSFDAMLMPASTPLLSGGTYVQLAMAPHPDSTGSTSNLLLTRVCAVTPDATVVCAGKGGQPAPLRLSQLSIGNTFACGLSETYAVPQCWGANSIGSVGYYSPPEEVTRIGQDSVTLTQIDVTSLKGTRACAVRNDTGTHTFSIFCWTNSSSVTLRMQNVIYDSVAGDCARSTATGQVSCYWPNTSPNIQDGPPPTTWRCSRLSNYGRGVCCVMRDTGELRCSERTEDFINTPYRQGVTQIYDPVPGRIYFQFWRTYNDDPNGVDSIVSMSLTAQGLSLVLQNGTLVTWYKDDPYFKRNVTLPTPESDPYRHVCLHDSGYCVRQLSGLVTCTGDLALGVPCGGTYSRLDCGGVTACVLTAGDSAAGNAGAVPLCWSADSATQTSVPFAAQTPKQPAVVGLSPATTYWDSTRGTSSACPNGTTSSYAGSGTALCNGQCTAGRYTSLSQQYCATECPPGAYCPQGTPAPVACPAGTFGGGNALKTSACTDLCTAGYYCPPGSTSATQFPCPIGRYGPRRGGRYLDDCIPCEPGSFNPVEGSANCANCPSGAYNFLTGAARCESCLGDKGLSCVLGGVANAKDYWTYMLNTTTQATTTVITTNGTVMPTLSLVSTSTIHAVPCPPNFCNEGSVCGTNRAPFTQNPMCGACAEGFTSWGADCIQCDETQGGIIFLLIVASFLYVFALYHMSQEGGSGDMKIFLYFVATARFMLGSDFGRWLNWIGLFDFSPQRSGSGLCIVPLTKYQNVALNIVVPLVFWAEIVFAAFVHWLYDNVTTSCCTRAQCAWWKLAPKNHFKWQNYACAFLSILLSSYSAVTDACLSYLNCYPVNGDRVMWDHPAISCNDSEYKSGRIGIGFLLAFPVVGLPVLVLPILLYLGSKQRIPANVTGFVQLTYTTQWFWWEIFATVRRSALVGVSVIFFLYPVQRSQALCLLNLLILLVHLYARPFRVPTENDMESASLLLLLVLSVLLIGQETELTLANAVLSSIVVLLPVVLWLIYKAHSEYTKRFGSHGTYGGRGALGGNAWDKARVDLETGTFEKALGTGKGGAGGGGPGGSNAGIKAATELAALPTVPPQSLPPSAVAQAAAAAAVGSADNGGASSPSAAVSPYASPYGSSSRLSTAPLQQREISPSVDLHLALAQARAGGVATEQPSQQPRSPPGPPPVQQQQWQQPYVSSASQSPAAAPAVDAAQHHAPHDDDPNANTIISASISSTAVASPSPRAHSESVAPPPPAADV